MMNNLPDSVQWWEGMLISPQHFQQNDIYWQQHLRHRLQAITPHYWGVQQMRLNLVKEVVSISELECILPDGLLVQFPGNPPHPPAGNLELDVSKIEKGSPQKVWLWVHERSTTAACAEYEDRRFDSLHGQLVADENTGEATIAVERLRVRCQLYLGNSTPSNDCACPLLELERNAQGILVITAYHPPLLHLSAAEFQQERSLQHQLDLLNERLWAKVQELSGNAGGAMHESGLGNESREHLAVARSLACCLPLFNLELRADNHPQALYRALAQVAGQAANIGMNPLPLRMKPYQHSDCLPQFLEAIKYIEARLDSVNTSYDCLVFTQLGESSFVHALPADIGEQFIIELKPHSTQTAEQLRRWIQDAIIASEQLMPQLMRTRLQGAAVRVLTAQEIEQYKLRPHASFFMIQNQPIASEDKGMQTAFSAKQNLLILGEANADRPAEITLYRPKQALQAATSASTGNEHE